MFWMNFRDRITHLDVHAGSVVWQIAITTFAIVLVLITCSTYAKDNEVVPDAIRWYQEMAAKGDVGAKYNLGMMYETGWSVPIDIEKAVRWYRDAANGGNAEAQLRLGMIYYLGLGRDQSKIKGESWIRKAANQENEFAKQLTDVLFTENVPDSVSRSKILAEARKAYLKNGGKAGIHLKKLIADAKRKAQIQDKKREESTIKERRETRVVAKANDTKVNSTETNAKKRKIERIKNVLPEFVDDKTLKENRTLERGNIGTIRFQAKEGQASAQYNLGRMYELGIKVPVDKKKALAWYKKSAAQSYADAEYRLAIAYLYGIYTDKNEELGMKWLSAAASHGHQVAMELRDKLEKNEGLHLSDQSIVVKWYLEQADAGNAESALKLGKIFQHGWGVVPDLRKAIKWYKRATLLGSKEAGGLLQNLNVDTIENGSDSASLRSGDDMNNGQPSNWIAYFLAGTVAIVIFFWPAIVKKKRNKKDSSSISTILNGEDSPFN